MIDLVSQKSKPEIVIKDSLLDEGQEIKGVDFSHGKFLFMGARKVKFIGCNFSYSRFVDTYFNDCTFERCLFTGAKLTDSNFRNSKFNYCEFIYAEFKNTHADYNELKNNFPLQPNLKQKFLLNLRKNYESLGERKIIQEILKDEIKSSHQYYSEAMNGESSYYKTRYNTFRSLLKLWIDKNLHTLSWRVWGHGEFPSRIFISTSIFLITASIFLTFYNYTCLNGIDIRQQFFGSCSDVFITFFGINGVISNSISLMPFWIKSLIVIMRYLALSLFTSTMIRRYSWR